MIMPERSMPWRGQEDFRTEPRFPCREAFEDERGVEGA